MKINFDTVIHLLHDTAFGALATQSAQMPGYPFASILPFVLDEMHCPVFLISALAGHTANLMADYRASLLLFGYGEQNILAGERLSVTGDVRRFDPSQEFVAHYLRYLPDAEQYLGLGDFSFFRLTPKRARYIGGFGQMGWIEGSEWEHCAVLPLANEVQLINEIQPHGVRLLGLDCYGFDMERNGKRERQRFPNGPLAIDRIGDVARRFLAAV